MSVKKSFSSMITAVLLVATIAVASAGWTVDSSGVGFVGKGDVQAVYGWNNAQLQTNAGLVRFRGLAMTEVSWECTNSNNEMIRERERTTTTRGLVAKEERVRNQITGFILVGFTAPATMTDGPPLNSCPSGPWTLTTPAGDPVVLDSRLQVSIGGTWSDLP